MGLARLLIVDDSAIMRRNLKHILEGAGFEVVGEGVDGKKGYDLYKELKPDLVTMDIEMPNVDGVTAVKNIIRDFPEAKIIMVSSLSQKSLVYNAIKSGAKNYIVKPIVVDKVIKVINEVLMTKSEVSKKPELQGAARFEVISITEEKEEHFTIKISEKINEKNFDIFLGVVDGILKSDCLGITFDFIGTRKVYNKIFEEILKVIDNVKEDIQVNILCEKENEDLVHWFDENKVPLNFFND